MVGPSLRGTGEGMLVGLSVVGMEWKGARTVERFEVVEAGGGSHGAAVVVVGTVAEER